VARTGSTSRKDVEPTFRNVVPVRAYEGVVDQVELAIFGGRLNPGDRLPSEREMMAQFAVSRATVREALRVLESRGLVRSRPGDPSGGPEVQASSSRALGTAVRSFARLGQMGIAELVQFRMVVEGSAIRLAAALHDDAGLELMERAYREMEDAVGGPYEAFSQADVAFHLSVAHCAKNDLLSACSEVAVDLVISLIRDKLNTSRDRAELMQDTLSRHGAYLDAIRARDGVRAERLARLDLYEYYSPFVDDNGRRSLEVLLEDPQTVSHG
jgi:GntR family transcriptional regulator, transcriptional repressor for pyruvate dehydrogenase complex